MRDWLRDSPRAAETAPVPEMPRRSRRGLLVSFLESEVQGSAAVGREILEQLAQVVAGERVRAKWTGNAHTLVIGKKTALITDEIDPESPTLRLPVGDLYGALDAWLDVVEGNGASAAE